MADIEPTQRRPGPGIAAELAAEGFEDAEEVGRGGFGVVYRCAQPELGRTVAVKVLTAALDPDGLARFMREQQAMGALSGHPHIVPVFQAGTTSGGHPYLVMPYHGHGSLAERIRTGGPLSWAEVLRLGVKTAGALETSHRAGILHRDVKPSNILLTDYGEPELTDFGIARVQGGFRTTTGVVTGSPAFAAPEVLRGAPATPAADVYGLGATLFCALTGHVAYERHEGEQVLAQFLRVANGPPVELTDADLPGPVRAVVEHAMAADPADRPLSAAALGEELRTAQRATGLGVEPLIVPTRTGPRPELVLGDDRATAPPTPATKFRPPKPPQPPTSRKRLLHALRPWDRPRFTVIHAPSGFGKTTLAAHLRAELQENGTAVAWLNLDADDAHPDWLLTHLLAAIRPCCPDLVDDLGGLLGAHSGESDRSVLTALVDGLHSRDLPLTVVLDDWDRAACPATEDILRFVAEHGCHHLALVLTTTVRPRVPLSRLRVHGDVADIDAAALRFDLDEVREFLDSAGVHLLPDEMVRLTRATDGWPAALQLAVLSLRAGEEPAHLLDTLAQHPDIDAFLTENVLDALEPELRSVLLAISVCERVCAELAVAVTGDPTAGRLLTRAQERGMFLHRSGRDGEWLHWHPLFAAHLRARLTRERPGDVAELHRRAAGWLAQRHLLNDAVDQALAADDPGLAADLVEQGGMFLFERSGLVVLQGILAKIPPLAGVTRPGLHLLDAWVHVLLRRREPAGAALVRFEAAMAASDLPDSARADLHAEADVIRAAGELFADHVIAVPALLGDVLERPEAFRPETTAVAANADMYAAIHRFDYPAARARHRWAAPYHAASGPFYTVYSHCFAGIAAREMLDITGASEEFGTALDVACSTMGPASHAARLAGALLGEIRYETGDPDTAADLLDRSHELSGEGGGVVDFMIATFAVAARVRALRGDPAGARELLVEGMAQARRLALPRLAARVRNEWVRLGFPVPPDRAVPILRPHTPADPADGVAIVVAELDEDSAVRLAAAGDDEASRRDAAERAIALAASIDAARRPLAALRAELLVVAALRRTGRSAEADRREAPLLRRCRRAGLARLPVDEAMGTGARG
ncbi:protein kinase domain-containing protein [Nocardia thailandica]